MRWRLDLYDITNATREAVLPYLAGGFRQGLPNDDTLEFTLPMYDERRERLFDTNDDASGTNQRYTLTPQKWVRLVDLDSAASKSYVIRDIKKERSADGQAVISVRAEGYAFKYLDKIVPLVTDFAGVTATIFLDQVLSGTGLTVGTNQIPTTEKRTVRIEYPNVIEALNVITDNWDETSGGTKKRFFWRINENNTVDIFREDTFGSTLVPKFSPTRNILSLQKEISSRRLVNRMFAATQDGGSLIEAQRTWYRDTIDGPDITVVGNTDTLTLNGYGDTSNKLAVRSMVLPEISTEVVWSAGGNADITISVELQTSGGTARARAEKKFNHSGSGTTSVPVKDLVLHVAENTDAEKLVLKFEAFTVNAGTVTSKRIWMHQVWYWTAPNVNYADGANQGTYGIVEGVFRDHPFDLMAHNLISDYKKITGTRASPTVTALEINGDFTGTYASGIAKGWAATSGSSGTFSENTDRNFITNGTSSQKLAATAGGFAIGVDLAESFPLRKKFSYFFLIILYIDTGQIEIDLLNVTSSIIEFAHTISGKGFFVLSGFFDNLSNAVPAADDSYKLRLVGTPLAGVSPTFYVDSVLVCQAGDRRPFTRKSIADDLRTKALDAMGLNEAPAKTFALDLADLGEMDPNVESARRFSPGDYIPIDDKTLNVSATLRVQSKTTDLLHPEKTQISVELLPTRPGDVIFRALGRRDLALQRS